MNPGFLSGLQSLSLNPSSSAATGQGATIAGPSSGAWTVNLGGSGVAFQGQSNPLMLAGLAALALGVLWIATRK